MEDYLEQAINTFYCYNQHIHITYDNSNYAINNVYFRHAVDRNWTKEKMNKHFKSVKEVWSLVEDLLSIDKFSYAPDKCICLIVILFKDMEQKYEELKRDNDRQKEVLMNMILINTELKRHLSE
jgi:hypothetical protein